MAAALETRTCPDLGRVVEYLAQRDAWPAFDFLAQVSLKDNGDGSFTFTRFARGETIPDSATLQAVQSSAAYATWLAEHGGDPLATARRVAKEIMGRQGDLETILRAVVLETLAYANAQRANFSTLLTWLGTQTTLINRNQLAAMALAQATPAQAKTAIQNRVTAGEAD